MHFKYPANQQLAVGINGLQYTLASLCVGFSRHAEGLIPLQLLALDSSDCFYTC